MDPPLHTGPTSAARRNMHESLPSAEVKTTQTAKPGDGYLLMGLQDIYNSTSSGDLFDCILPPKLLSVNHSVGIANEIKRITGVALTSRIMQLIAALHSCDHIFIAQPFWRLP